MRLERRHLNEELSQTKFPLLEIGGKIIPRDDAGYLLDFNDWTPAVPKAFAKQDGIELIEDHWILINFLHRFYQEFELAPEMPILSRNLCKDQQECRWTRRYIKQLFPDGAKGACRYAGLPAPVGRSCL